MRRLFSPSTENRIAVYRRRNAGGKTDRQTGKSIRRFQKIIVQAA